MKTGLSSILSMPKLLIVIMCALIWFPCYANAMFTNAAGIGFDSATNTFKINCAIEGTDVPCSDLDLSPYQFFWKFGTCGYSFEPAPSYSFKEGEPQEVSVSLKRINIYDEEYGPSKLGFSKTFTGLDVELPNASPVSNTFDLSLDASGDVRGLFQSVIVINYENRTTLDLLNGEIVVELSHILDQNVAVQTCCSGVTYTRTMSDGKDLFAFTIDQLNQNEPCNIYLVYGVDAVYKDLVNESVHINAASFIHTGPDKVKRPQVSTSSLKSATSSRLRSDADSLSLKVTEPFDPNSKTAVPSGCISAGDLVTYTISFLNEGSANTNLVDIIDTLSELLDISSLEFESLNIMGIDQDISAPSVRLEVDGNILQWEFPAVLPPDPGSTASQGFLTYSVRTKDEIPQETILSNRATIIFDKGQGIITNKMAHQVNCKNNVKGTSRYFIILFRMLVIIIILLMIILLLQIFILIKS